MTRSIIDPITRIEGHLRVEMEVENGKVSDAWVSGGCFRGMELVVKDRTPEDAAQILSLIHISEPTRLENTSRMPSSA